MAIALDDIPTESGAVTADQRPGLPFSFTGRAGEYFGIWIVNILLSIITLGIYSAWAKVRNKRYFYGNTLLEGRSFDYLASPIQILIGRLIVFGVFLAYAVFSTFFPVVSSLFLIALFLLTPWAVVSAYRFNARNSGYRNVRFHFTGGYWEAFKIYILMPIATLFTLGLLAPYNAFRMKQFQIDRAQYGQTDFHFEGKAGSFYRIYGVTLLLWLPVLAVGLAWIAFSAYVLAQLAMSGMEGASTEQEIANAIQMMMLQYGHYLAMLPVYLFFAVISAIVGYTYLVTALQNYAMNNMKLAEHRFYLDLNFWRILWIRFSNLIVIGFTAGLMIPWARVRMARYQIERMSLVPAGDLETLVSEEQKKVSALGDEFGESMDLDLGLGV